MSHPIQPQSYIEMNNFYTMTVYEKGAEVVRLYHTLLGEEGFRKGMDLYFERHDGQAVTVESFRDAMADANGVDLSQMHNWYVQNGTPVLKVETEYDEQSHQLKIHCEQSLPRFSGDFKPMLMPIKIALFSEQGHTLPLATEDEAVKVIGDEALLNFTQERQSFAFCEISSQPVLSVLRGFSAPVILEYVQSDQELAFLVKNDTDSFVRWESMQTLAMRDIKRNIELYQAKQSQNLSDAFKSAFEEVLLDQKADQALKALTLVLPDLTYIGEQYSQMDVDAIYHVHRWMKAELAALFETRFLEIYQSLAIERKNYEYNSQGIAQRKLKNVCLQYLLQLPQYIGLAEEQYHQGGNMTDVLAALEALSHTDSQARELCLQDFYAKWKDDTLVLDKWFTLQSASHHIHALEHVKELVQHPDFVYTNPNRVRSVLGVFGRLNMLGFHRANGEGYQFLAEQVLKLDEINPQVAARIVAPFTHWQHLDDTRQEKMKSYLQEMLSKDNLSKDVYEIVSKSLNISTV